MYNYRRTFLKSLPVLLCLLCCNTLHGQEMAGSDRFTPLNRSLINPAFLYDTPYCLEINLLTTNMGAHNNYFYVPRRNLYLPDLLNPHADIYHNPGDYIRRNRSVSDGFAQQYIRVLGPSFLVKYRQHAIALTTGVRTQSAARQVPFHIMNFAANGLSYSSQHNLTFDQSKSFPASSMSWAELGISYATILADHKAHHLTAGISFKRLWAYHALNVQSRNISYMVSDQESLQINRYNALVQAALPMDYQANELDGTQGWVKGRGFSFDLGVAYTQKSTRKERTGIRGLFSVPKLESYKYQLGFALRDMGVVKMNDNVKEIEFEEVSLFWEDPGSEDFDNIDDLLDALESRLTSGSIDRQDGGSFWMALPTSASVQFDYRVQKNVFAQVWWVQDIPLGHSRLAGVSQIGVMPRYETRWFSLALPFSLFQYQKPRLGASVRLGFLTIGSDQLGGIFHTRDTYGLDFYFSLRWGFHNCQWVRSRGNPCFDHILRQ